MKVQPVAVYVQDLELSEKSKNALLRCGIRTLNELMLRRHMEISCIRGLGDSGVKEVQALLARSESVFAEFEERARRIQQIYPEVCGISIMEIPVETRTRNILQRSDIHNFGDLIRLSGKDIAELPGIGPETRSQLEMLINGIIENGKSCIANWKTAKLVVQRETLQKGFDFPLIDRLASEYFLKSADLADWFGLSRQRIHQIMKERPAKRADCWTGKSLSGEEKSVLAKLVEAKTFESQSQNAKCACFNNKCDDFACIFVCEQEIKAFFLKELPDDLQIQIRAARMHQLSAAELNDLKQGTFVSILKQTHFVPKNSADFRENANLRGFSEDEYSRFLSGFPYASPKAVTDEESVRFLRGKLTEGRVYLPSDSGSRWVRAFAAQHHMGIRELVEFYGYKVCLTSRELADVRTRRKHIEELTPHIVRGNVVYFPIESTVYRNLNAYAGQKRIPLNQYVESLGFTRTFERSALAQDDLEADMRSYGDEDIFASCPLLGNRILDPETLDNLNFSARKSIDTVLERPSIKLSFEAQKGIALALINHAKHWDGAAKTDFWTYLALQFGFRDKDGAVVEIFQEALQKALEQSGRLFVTDRNGRAFKTTILIHALGPKRSWMALYDLLFNFYKDNLHWRYSPEEPLLGSMIEALKRKLGNADVGKDALLQICFSTYRFQEGICKLILLRPRYTRHLFEHMLWKIDALVKMKNYPAETYVDVLADEWFQSKLLSASSTGRLKKQMPEIAAVAAEYSRVRIRYILRNRNEICLSIPDIRLKNADFERITVSICVNSVPAQQIELGWYGDELGKTMQGQIIPLLTGLERVSVRISCDNDLIYDSGSSLFREIFIFAGEREIKKTAIQKGCYTFVLPESDALFCEKARIKEVEGFRCTGFRAYFADLQAGYILRAGEKRIAFDKEDGHFRAVLPPESLILPSLTIEQEELLLAKTGSVLTVLLNKAAEISKYQFYRNGRRVRVSPAEEKGCSEITLECPLAGDRLSECRIQVIDIAWNRTLFDKRFLLVSDANMELNREFYYSQADYQDSSVTLQIDDFFEKIVFSEGEDELFIPFRSGMFQISIPRLQVQESTGLWLSRAVPAWWIGDIPQESFLKITAPDWLCVHFSVAGRQISCGHDGVAEIGNLLHSIDRNGPASAKIMMTVQGRQEKQIYCLTTVFFQEGFLRPPKFWPAEGRLCWDGGSLFIGKSKRTFTLSLIDEQGQVFTFSISDTIPSITLPETMLAGRYSYQVSIISGVLKKKEICISEGECFIGDPDSLRFQNRRIRIETITDINSPDRHIPIQTCYIDNIRFFGRKLVESEGCECPIYTGIMYSISDGRRFDFSYTNHQNHSGKQLRRVNPVKIVYLNDSVLSITDFDDDGLVYYHYYDRTCNAEVYSITDHEPTEQNRKKYSVPDLYLYQTEGGNDV